MVIENQEAMDKYCFRVGMLVHLDLSDGSSSPSYLINPTDILLITNILTGREGANTVCAKVRFVEKETPDIILNSKYGVGWFKPVKRGVMNISLKETEI
jgi:hypothetical protein